MGLLGPSPSSCWAFIVHISPCISAWVAIDAGLKYDGFATFRVPLKGLCIVYRVQLFLQFFHLVRDLRYYRHASVLWLVGAGLKYDGFATFRFPLSGLCIVHRVQLLLQFFHVVCFLGMVVNSTCLTQLVLDSVKLISFRAPTEHELGTVSHGVKLSTEDS
mmetsp:Transcript_2330/g.3651  ORF Transcript_2330/g.3651 Transcript_2330/m.3651 type:complete len:161 (-) Transcript_2330:669-1151(-)